MTLVASSWKMSLPVVRVTDQEEAAEARNGLLCFKLATQPSATSDFCHMDPGNMAVVQTWQRMKRRNKKLNSWENKHVLKCELDDAAVRKAKQKRRAPPVPSVNQLAWSQDDMLVCLSCYLCLYCSSA